MAAAFAVFLVLWGSVVVGQRVLIGGDVLYQYEPWAGEPGDRPPSNAYVGDPVTQFVAWTGLVKDSFRRGELPLWNPYTLSGTPLLANDQSSPFSPFTLAAILFRPARGLSLAMLMKLWVAGIGMAVFVRLHGARAPAAAVAGIAYATSSFMVVWLAYPHTGVAALMPWGFAAVAWYFRTRRGLAVVAVAVAVALQFFAGHAETSLHLGVGLAIYVVVRLVGTRERRTQAVLGLGAAVVLGTLLSGIQLLPFTANLLDASLVGDRELSRTGFTHLEPKALTTWVFPNSTGSPGIDGEAAQFPVYPESTGYVGVGALLLAGLAVPLLRGRWRWETGALVAVVAVSVGTIYGVLSPLAGRTPMLAVANNVRFFTVACFGVAALAGLGLDRLLAKEPRRSRPALSRAMVGAGMVALAALVVAAILVAVDREGLRDLLPTFRGRIGFWLATGAVAGVCAVAFLLARRFGAAPTWVVGGFAALALLEAVLFAFPYNPRVRPSQAPPASPAIEWLRQNLGDGSVAARGLDLIPNTASEARLRDPRGVETLINPRVRTYWSSADPGYDDSFLYTVLDQPDPRWLAGAGVTHFLTRDDSVLPGTEPAFQAPGMVISRVPGARPFVFAAAATVTAADEKTAAEALARDPLGPVVVERKDAGVGAPAAGDALVEMRIRSAQTVSMGVEAPGATTLVVLQAFTEGWRARVDGKVVPIEPANVLFQSVQVPAGSHEVTFRYEPSSVRLGLAATAAALLGLSLVVLVPVLRRRRGLPTAP